MCACAWGWEWAGGAGGNNYVSEFKGFESETRFLFVSLFLFFNRLSRPDMTFAVDWALSNNYLSIYQQAEHFGYYPVISIYFVGFFNPSILSLVVVCFFVYSFAYLQ